jgi:hypothetical protein
MGVRRLALARTSWLSILFFVVACILVCSNALAMGYGPFGEFGSFSSPAGVAVDNSGSVSKEDVYVVDIGNDRVAKFHPNALDPSDLEEEPALTGFTEPTYIGVSPKNGDVFVSDSVGDVVDQFDAEGTKIGSMSPGEFEPFGVAVDPVNGDVYVADRSDGGRIDVFEEESPGNWKLINQFGVGDFTGGLDSLAFDSDGNLYVTSQEQAIEEFNASGAPVVCPVGKPHEGTNFVDSVDPQSVAVDSSDNHIFVGENAERSNFKIAEYSSPCSSPIEEFGEGDFGGGGSYGIALSGATHAFYGSQIGGSVADVFISGLTPEPPPVTVGGTVEEETSATLEGELLGEETSYHFEYSKTSDTCEGGTSTTPVPDTATGEKITEKITGLEPSTKYAFCLVEENGYGPSYGSSLTFTTGGVAPSEPETGEATGVAETGAQLTGELNANGKATYYFEYGTAPCGASTCGTKTPEGGPLHGAVKEPVGAVALSGLTPGKTYHYWIVATNAKGTVHGEAKEFTTLHPEKPSGVVTEPASTVKATTAVLNGKFDPGSAAKYYFEYGTERCATAKVACTKSTEEGPLMGFTQQPASLTLTGLATETTYYYRIVATNVEGTEYGNEETFTPGAPGEVRTEPAEEVTETSAYLAGELDANGSAKYYYEYGTEPCGVNTCGTRTIEEGAITGETRKVVESIQVQSLLPGTRYYYRIVAANHTGTTVRGNQGTFTTTPAAPVTLTPVTLTPSTNPITPVIATSTSATGSSKPTTTKTTVKPKALTKTQKLAGALKQCRKEKQKGKRARCEKQAKKKYPVAKPKRVRK